ncbi:toll/interleukin-1 receptor domain-containing protein [Bradyrhizobium betae]|uniref:TIR domain-containing protein n=1 Tax=Bradyrhizobium betae TaxID=244734 RepID=A0A4Q1UKR4_9BRAD|nr:toll/interleukin-1 receptor domain-containing protein [Bradyrhizobium betae]RXT35348.1 hypothetical protein B5V03_36365 [Bradyrhizobium betae]
MGGGIFISYRRDDDPSFAHLLFERLARTFGHADVFFDVDAIPLGADFVQVLEEKVAQSSILLVVIGIRWLDAANGSKRRLDDPRDFVRLEIEAALSQKKLVIPVLVGRAEMPSSDQLPDTLHSLATRQFLRIRHETLRSDLDELNRRLEKIVATSNATVDKAVTANRLGGESSRPPKATNDKLEDIASAIEAALRYGETGPRGGVDRPPPPSTLTPYPKPVRPARTGSPFPFKNAVAIGIALVLAGAGILQVATNLFTSSPTQQVVEAPKDPAQPQSKPKIPDRIGQPSSDQSIVPVAQKAALCDEDPSDPKGKQYVGTVIWRLEPIKALGNQKADVAVRADIEIPDRKFKMTMSFRRNTDSSLPASHTAELTFVLPLDFPGGGVSSVPGILLKPNEQARGTPLAGMAVKVTDGFFLVGLSNVDADRSRNVQLLKARSWFEVPLVYANQRRGTLIIEKGVPGERAFSDAFAQWGD